MLTDMKFFNPYAALVAVGLAALMGLTACDDDDSYAERRDRERSQIASFVRNGTCQISSDGDTLLYVAPIKVISEEQFEAQDSTTNVAENEYVYFESRGVYMQIVSKGSGETLADGDTRTVLARYTELNISTDSIQSSNYDNNTHASDLEVMTVSNSSGTYSASFISGQMKTQYNSTTVPGGWLIPMPYIRLGRQDGNAVAKVRLIVPSTEGQQSALGDVYPCFYEIRYMRSR